MRFPERLDKVPQPEAAASTDQSRPILTHLHLRIEENEDGERRGWLEATDSYQLVRIPVELDKDDEAGLLPAEAVAQTRKLKAERLRARAGSATVEANGASATFDRPAAGIFPNVPQLVPEQYATFRIGLDVALLGKVAKALGTTKVALSFTAGADGEPAPLRPVKVEPLGASDGRVAVVMPHRLP